MVIEFLYLMKAMAITVVHALISISMLDSCLSVCLSVEPG